MRSLSSALALLSAFLAAPSFGAQSQVNAPDLRYLASSFVGGAYSFQPTSASFGTVLSVNQSTGVSNWSVSDVGAITTTSGLTTSSNATTGFIRDNSGNCADLMWIRGGNPTPTDNYLQVQPTAQTTPLFSVRADGQTSIKTALQTTALNLADGTNSVTFGFAATNNFQVSCSPNRIFIIQNGSASPSMAIRSTNNPSIFELTGGSSGATNTITGATGATAAFAFVAGGSTTGYSFKATAVPTIFIQYTHGNAAVAAQIGFDSLDATPGTTPQVVQIDSFGNTDGFSFNVKGAPTRWAFDVRSASTPVLMVGTNGDLTAANGGTTIFALSTNGDITTTGKTGVATGPKWTLSGGTSTPAVSSANTVAFMYDANTNRLKNSVNAAAFGSLAVNNVQMLQTPGAGTYTVTGGTNALLIYAVAGGGGGGGAATTAAATSAGAGGGSSGSGCWHYLPNPLPTYTYVIGAGGATPVAGANAGGNGADTTFAAIFTCNGGKGGAGAAAAAALAVNLGGSAPAISTGATVNFGGTAGAPGLALTTILWMSGNGAPSMFGGGPSGKTGGAAVGGVAGLLYGDGGSGAGGNNGAAQSGGAGGNGVIIVYELK